MKRITISKPRMLELAPSVGKAAAVLLAAAAVSYGAERLVAALFYGGDAFYYGRYLAIFACAEMAGLFFCFRDIVARKVEIAVLVVILSVGTVFAAVLPASCGVSWDDEWHYYYPMLISHILSPGVTGAELYYVDHFTDTALNHENYDRESQEEFNEEADSRYLLDKKGLIGRYWPGYRNWCYLPAAFGLWAGRVMNLPYHMTFKLGRWCNLLFYAAMVFFAVRRLKSGKMIAAVVALLPFNLFMAASYSYDTWVTAWFLYGFCFYFGELQQPEKKMKASEWLCMALAFFIGAGPKMVYIPLLLAVLLMPASKFESRRQRNILLLAVAALTVGGLGGMAFSFLLPGDGAPAGDARGGQGVDAMGQISYIFSHPLEYAGILLRFLGEYVSPGMACQSVGNLHYFTRLQAAPGSALMVVALAVVGFTDKAPCDREVPLWRKACVLALSFAALCLVATSMYVAFTPVGKGEILGCQYRYIAPVIFPVLYCVGSGKIENRMDRRIYNGAVLGICAAVSISIAWAYAIDLY